jgi:hypothetical protein
MIQEVLVPATLQDRPRTNWVDLMREGVGVGIL